MGTEFRQAAFDELANVRVFAQFTRRVRHRR